MENVENVEFNYIEMLAIQYGLEMLIDRYKDQDKAPEILIVAQGARYKIDGIIRSYETMTFDEGELKEEK